MYTPHLKTRTHTMKIPRGTSESSTTSDNTGEFIEIVRKHDVVYNTHNPDYKNVEVKLKVWSQIAEEIGLSVDASKRKWKNLRDSYTKYLRSFRVGTKTSKKYQYWAHADHMDFLKPYQGPPRDLVLALHKAAAEEAGEETDCDLGFQVLAKASSPSSEEDQKPTPRDQHNKSPHVSSAANTSTTTTATTPTSATAGAATPASPHSNGLAMNMPSLPIVALPPTSTGKNSAQQLMPPTTTSASNGAGSMSMSPPLTFPPIPSALANGSKGAGGAMPPLPATSSASSVGCLIIDPPYLAVANALASAAAADSLKKEFNASMANFGLFQAAAAAAASASTNSPCHVTTTTPAAPRSNPPLITKIRRVPQTPAAMPSASVAAASKQSPTQGAINLSFSATSSASEGRHSAKPPSACGGPPPAKVRKPNGGGQDVDVSAVLHANRDLDANTLFFLSLARTVRQMPTKLQSLAKMRCMRIVSDIELELESMDCNSQNGTGGGGSSVADGQQSPSSAAGGGGGGPGGSEHFIYVMSPSRVESMIDISSDDEGGASMAN